MHSPYASKKRQSSDVPSLHSGGCLFFFRKCFYSTWVMCSVGQSLCAVVCMALTVQEYRDYTPDHSMLLPLTSGAGPGC